VISVAVRPAAPGDLGALSDLAFRSKGYWGYSAEFLEACREELTVTAQRLDEESIWVAEAGGEVLGFAASRVEEEVAELVDLFVEPEHIGSGVGAALWAHVIAHVAATGATRLRIEADPHAEEWYQRRGAVRVGETPSGSIPGRLLPLLEYSLE
jgi:GNAT superfamily N-acetyltransferase